MNDDIPEDAYRLYVFEEIQRNLKSQSRYLGTIESILFLIDNEIEKPAESAYYIKILASQLTVHEVKYIFYQCLISSSETPLVKLINKLKLLDERLTEADINESIIKHYNEIHGTDFLIDAKAPSFMPFTKAEIKEFKSKYNKLIKKD